MLLYTGAIGMSSMLAVIGVLTLIMAGYLFYRNGKHQKSNNLDPVDKLTSDMAEKVINSVPDMIFIVDKEYKIRRILNVDPLKLIIAPDELIGVSLLGILNESAVPDAAKKINKALESDEVQELEYSIPTEDGSFRYFEGRFKRIQDGLVACFEREITERKLQEKSLLEAKKNMESAQRMNQLILNNTNSGLIFINPDFKVEWENVAQYSSNELARKYKTGTFCYKEVMGRTEPCEFCVAMKAFASKKVEQEEIKMTDDLSVCITATPLFNEDGTPSGAVLKFDDITARRKADEELKRAKEAAEASDKLKSVFLSNMSHEIRTPLNAIVGFSELLVSSEEFEDQESYVGIIKRNNDLLLQLINDILDLSKIESNSLEFNYGYVDVNAMMDTIYDTVIRKIEGNEYVSITLSKPAEHCVLYTEGNRVQQVLLNLLGNAIKFTPEGTIIVGYEVEEEGMRFFVSDTGKGIPADRQHEIFDRFVKLDNFMSGTGLGLSICQTIINKLDGKIGVESTEGEGSTFWFTLPIKPVRDMSQKDEQEGTASQEANLLKKTDKAKSVILIAEDERDNYMLYETILKKEYTLLHAWDGEEAVELFDKHQHEIDFIIMDIKMPKMDGYGALTVIRSMNADIPVIAASAYAFAEDVRRIKDSGFNSYIAKPLNKSKLLAALEELKK